ncbi:PUB domain-containing protein [Phytophthora infestans]|uniref:PUB domain-containing protein n=1 Tax=Phytophthora infestans TaxID=4787 RepID=A0A833WBD7_PHYIN|nr:PUB domain-containing protein [Phytophthora infestans]KAF4129325.1 PUB domain-containing protein [Phytophthora infestans]
MDWLKKKKEAAQQAAAKISNKRTAFRGEGNVLGGGDAPAAAAPAPDVSRRPSIKLPFASHKPPALSAEEQQKRRELQAKALEQRGNAWEKRVANGRKARLQEEEELESKFQYAEPASLTAEAAPSGPPPVLLSNEQVKARELQSAHQQMGFNPYAATFSSSTQAVSAINGIGAEAIAPPPAPSGDTISPPAPFPAIPQVAAPDGVLTNSDVAENGAVYVLLRQDPPRAITAAETLIKMLANVLKNPQEEKFRKIRLSNAAIQSKLTSVPGAVGILAEAGFSRVELEGEVYLMLIADAFQAERVQSALDRTEVALIQLQHDSA